MSFILTENKNIFNGIPTQSITIHCCNSSNFKPNMIGHLSFVHFLLLKNKYNYIGEAFKTRHEKKSWTNNDSALTFHIDTNCAKC